MSIREKIMAIKPVQRYALVSSYKAGHADGLIAAADIAEAEVARLEDVIHDFEGLVAQYVIDERLLKKALRYMVTVYVMADDLLELAEIERRTDAAIDNLLKRVGGE